MDSAEKPGRLEVPVRSNNGEVTLRPIDIAEAVARELENHIARIKKLSATEWQRWVPGPNAYRFFVDNIYPGTDGPLLKKMHPTIYEIANDAYNAALIVGMTTVATLGVQGLISKLY